MGDTHVAISSQLYYDPKRTTENFSRLCQFLVTICGDVMRDILSHFIKPAKLRSELDMHKEKLEKIMNQEEKDKLYPPHQSTSCIPEIRSKDLDITLLYKILRNLCNIQTHFAGWGNKPEPRDFSLAACIERIHFFRNSFPAHSPQGMVDNVEFENTWRELRRSVVEMEREVIGSDRYERGIDHLYDCDLNPTKSKECVDLIQKMEGEMVIKREKLDRVEENENAKRAKLEIVEKKQTRLEDILEKLNKQLTEHTELLTSIKTEMPKVTEELQQINSKIENIEEGQATLIESQEELAENFKGILTDCLKSFQSDLLEDWKKIQQKSRQRRARTSKKRLENVEVKLTNIKEIQEKFSTFFKNTLTEFFEEWKKRQASLEESHEESVTNLKITLTKCLDKYKDETLKKLKESKQENASCCVS